MAIVGGEGGAVGGVGDDGGGLLAALAADAGENDAEGDSEGVGEVC